MSSWSLVSEYKHWGFISVVFWILKLKPLKAQNNKNIDKNNKQSINEAEQVKLGQQDVQVLLT